MTSAPNAAAPEGRPPACVDLFVIGGGIQGAGVARDAAGRGLSVVLCEKDDLASGTSWASSKLVHGGLRYLEHGELRLVHEALAEREILLNAAPHLVRPLRFLLPHAPWLRSAWTIRMGLFLYDHLARRSRLQGSDAVSLSGLAAGRCLKPELSRGFLYSDCLADDARLVLANARDAARRGATICLRTEVLRARRADGEWRIECRATDLDGRTTLRAFRARALVNAAGPWARRVLDDVVPSTSRSRVRKVKGSHVVVPDVGAGDTALILQHEDRRVVFVIPWFGHSLVGTTDVPLEGDPGDAEATPEEVEYLCEAANRFLRTPLSPDDVVFAFAGVRPLFDEGDDEDVSSNSRDDHVEREGLDGEAPLVSVFGGKLTTYRKVAERVLRELRDDLPEMHGEWTHAVPLPGGALDEGNCRALLSALHDEHRGVPGEILSGLVARHGSEARAVLGDARTADDLGRRFASDLTEREIAWMAEREWARTLDDVILRRSKAVLTLASEDRAPLEACITRAARGVAARAAGDAAAGRR
ncbi:MAG: glycerol-3-phosphate dehydrogenase [Planctomycetes bacterium]|nr:glycerol-3-phosphate dehydrogenase [Planctomycetota bacterium]